MSRFGWEEVTSYKRWEKDLWYPEESNIQHGVHACNPGSAWEWECIGVNGSIGGIVTVVAVEGRIFDTGEDEKEKDCQAHAGGYYTQ